MKHISFIKTRKVKSPNRANEFDAGMDFFIPDDMDWDSFSVWPNASLLIDSGIRMNVPPGTALICLEKSSVAKTGLIIGAKVVDAEYQGNIHIHVINTGKQPVTISRGQKIAQFVLIPVFNPVPVEVETTGDLFKTESSRGAGGFGSTGNGLPLAGDPQYKVLDLLDGKKPCPERRDNWCVNNCVYPNCNCDAGPNPV